MSDNVTANAPAAESAPAAAPAQPPPAPPMGQLTLPPAVTDGVLARLAQAAVPPVMQPPAPVVAQPPATQQAQNSAPTTATQTPDAHAATLATLRSALVRTEVLRVAEREGAIDPDTLLSLVSSRYDITDDGRVIVRDDPRSTVQDDVKRYLAAKPYLLRPLAPAGGSPAGAVVQTPPAPLKPDLATNAGLTDMTRKLAANMGLRRG
jgi:hypothetical protein